MSEEFEPSAYNNPTDILQRVLERSQHLYTEAMGNGGFPLDVFLWAQFADGQRNGYQYAKCIGRAKEISPENEEKQEENIRFVNWIFDLIAESVENGISPKRSSSNCHAQLMQFIAKGSSAGLFTKQHLDKAFVIDDQTQFMVNALEVAKQFHKENTFEQLESVEISIIGTDTDGQKAGLTIPMDLGDE